MWKDCEIGEGRKGGGLFDAEGGYLCWWVSGCFWRSDDTVSLTNVCCESEFLRIRKVPMISQEPVADDQADEKTNGPRIDAKAVLNTVKKMNAKDRDMYEKVCFWGFQWAKRRRHDF